MLCTSMPHVCWKRAGPEPGILACRAALTGCDMRAMRATCTDATCMLALQGKAVPGVPASETKVPSISLLPYLWLGCLSGLVLVS